MNIDIGRTMALIMLPAIVTFTLRAVPFVVFGKKEIVNPVIRRMGVILPMAIMATLIIYCIKDVTMGQVGDNIKMLIAIAVVAVLHICKKNTLLSVAAGTAIYMIII